MAHTEKKLCSELIYQGRIITVTQDTVELENGKQTLREMVHHHGGAAIVPVDENGNVYLVRQFRYPMGRELLEIPAGKLEPGGGSLYGGSAGTGGGVRPQSRSILKIYIPSIPRWAMIPK